MRAKEEEILVPWSAVSGGLATQVRSSLLTSSILALRECGHFERYVTFLPEEHHQAVLYTAAPMWLPIEHAIAHYRACDALDLQNDEMLAVGTAVGGRIRGSSLSSVAKVARNMGGDPWLALVQSDVMFQRIFQGGGVQVVKLGPKDARLDIRGLPLFEFAYFRNAFIGVLRAAADLFARRTFIRELPGTSTETSASYAHSWV